MKDDEHNEPDKSSSIHKIDPSDHPEKTNRSIVRLRVNTSLYFECSIVHLQFRQLESCVEIYELRFETGCFMTLIEIGQIKHFQEKWKNRNERRRSFIDFDQKTNAMKFQWIITSCRQKSRNKNKHLFRQLITRMMLNAKSLLTWSSRWSVQSMGESTAEWVFLCYWTKFRWHWSKAREHEWIANCRQFEFVPRKDSNR